MKQYYFEGAAIRALRSVVTTHWLSMMTIAKANGWHKSDLDPTNLVDYFDSLSLKSGFVLRAYERLEVPNSWSSVWAMPSKLPFPEPRINGNGRPVRPDGALNDVMEAIEGDDSPYSYLSASILARELSQFATLSPESEWLNCFVLGSDPWHASKGVGHALKGQGFIRERAKWKWTGQQPDRWRPTVFMSQRSVTVVFHAFTGSRRQRILSFEDRYLRGSYSFSRQEKSVASGPEGYVW